MTAAVFWILMLCSSQQKTEGSWFRSETIYSLCVPLARHDGSVVLFKTEEDCERTVSSTLLDHAVAQCRKATP